MMQRKKIRMKDIAEGLGLSVSTVSRALNDRTANFISNDLVKKIRSHALSVGYVLNSSAGLFSSQQNQIVGMVVPDLLNPVFPPIIKGAQELLRKLDKTLIVSYSENNQATALQEVKRLLSLNVSGLLIASAFLNDDSVDYCLDKKVPLVLISRSINNGENIHRVLSDDWHGMELTIRHLKSLGHNKILHVAGPMDIIQGRDRKEAFEKISILNAIEAEVIQADGFSIESGQITCKQFIADGGSQTAIIASNDLIAIGFAKCLNSYGYRIPEHYSLVGFNNMPLSEQLNPSLTSVAIPHFELGRLGARLLLDDLAGCFDEEKKTFKILPHLIQRESSGAPCAVSEISQLKLDGNCSEA